MALIEMYDYVSTVTPDYSATTLSLTPHNVMSELSEKNQVIHTADDNSEERISLSDDNIFRVTLAWEVITESEAGTIVDFYYDSAKGNGIARTFKWNHPTDDHTYVVRFDGKITRQIRPASLYDIKSITLRVVGRIAD